MKKFTLLACLASSIPATVIAEQQSTAEVYLGASRYLWDSERDLENNNGIDLGAELPLSEELSLEAWLSDAETEAEGSGIDVDSMRYSLGGLYHFSNDDLRPFVSLGASHQAFDVNSRDDEETLAYLGAGVKKYFDNNLMVRAEILGLNSLDNELTDAIARVSIGYAFGRSSKSAAVEAVQKVAETRVETEKKQPEQSVAKAPAPKPAPVPAPAPKDSDLDGVIDENDQCKGTDKAFEVDDKGCPVMLVEPVSINLNVQFPSNSAALGESGLSEIKRVADFMNQFDKTTVVVEGHTDDRGKAAYNKSLSQKRANAVRQALLENFGIEASRVSAQGFGEEKPIADNSTAEGRAKNRRVVAIVEGEARKPVMK